MHNNKKNRWRDWLCQILSGAVCVVFEKADHGKGVIKEQNVSSDVFEQYYNYGDELNKNNN